ncbi:hypothetical protein CHU98_g6225 [Xylaria longipes]|nr:hypothetical protein CHU98_g6225 [Xylaria longipes]
MCSGLAGTSVPTSAAAASAIETAPLNAEFDMNPIATARVTLLARSQTRAEEIEQLELDPLQYGQTWISSSEATEMNPSEETASFQATSIFYEYNRPL